MQKEQMSDRSVFTLPVIITTFIAFGISTCILTLAVGIWEGVRHGVFGALLLAIWIFAFKIILGDQPAPEPAPIKRPLVELLVLIVALAGMMTMATLNYLDLGRFGLIPYLMVSAGLMLLVHLLSRYPAASLGFRLPTKRAWMAVLTVILVNFLFAAVYQILPAGEGATPAGSDLSQQITGPFGVLLLLGGLLLRAALPEELILRVGLQPRLAAFVGIGFAILLQALLFAAGHLPQQVFGYERTLPLALPYVLPIENGIIAGYIWYRTRSLPLLLLLHLFAFPRIGR